MMNCKHLKVEGNTTKYYFCNAKKKAIDNIECKNCLLKISVMNGEDIYNFMKGITNEK